MFHLFRREYTYSVERGRGKLNYARENEGDINIGEILNWFDHRRKRE